VKKARMLQDDVFQFRFGHSDLAIYNLNTYAIRSHRKKLMKNRDMKDIHERISTMWPETNDLPSLTVVDKLPKDCGNLFIQYQNSKGCWKVEWLMNGLYDVQMSAEYKARYLRFSKGNNRSTYSMLWEGMGFSSYDVGYKLWLESLYRPSRVIKYEGNAFHINSKKVKFQTARVMTHLFDFNHLVTVTVIE